MPARGVEDRRSARGAAPGVKADPGSRRAAPIPRLRSHPCRGAKSPMAGGFEQEDSCVAAEHLHQIGALRVPETGCPLHVHGHGAGSCGEHGTGCAELLDIRDHGVFSHVQPFARRSRRCPRSRAESPASIPTSSAHASTCGRNGPSGVQDARNFYLGAVSFDGEPAESLRERLGRGARLRVIDRVAGVERIDQPRPGHVGEKRVGANLRLQRRLGRTARYATSLPHAPGSSGSCSRTNRPVPYTDSPSPSGRTSAGERAMAKGARPCGGGDLAHRDVITELGLAQFGHGGSRTGVPASGCAVTATG